MQNGISSLENLFAVSAFRIPQYQRAYSWDPEPQLEAFLEDLRQQVRTQKTALAKQYFLGTFLLHEQDVGDGKVVVNVVDGQQRMTTSVLFIATALALEAKGSISLAPEKSALLRRHFVFDDEDERQKFHTIAEDEPIFRSAILGIAAAADESASASSRRLRDAAQFFIEHVAHDEWAPLVAALKTARVMVYSVDTAEAATQIFELQNDRGKPLTSLEALKSFLMHCIYLHSPRNADDRLGAMQTQFAKIFRTVEALADQPGAPDEDRVLAYHCAAYLRWTEKDEYSSPKQLVKRTVKGTAEPEIIGRVEAFVAGLVDTYGTVKQLFERQDKLPELAELLLLRRMASFWPLLLKTWGHDQTTDKRQFRKVCRLLEVFAFRAYAVANLRADTSQSWLHARARDFAGDFPTLLQQLTGLCDEYRLEEKFAAGLDNPAFYQSEGGDGLYLLFRYENHLRSQKGKVQPLLTWRDYVEPRNYAAKLSVEHVAAQGHPIAETDVAWDDKEAKPFADVALHRLGNLVIDSVSPNASKGKKDFTDKLKSLSEESIYLSQGELIRFVKDPANPSWDVEAIRARHAHLLAFAQKTWNPQHWHDDGAKP